MAIGFSLPEVKFLSIALDGGKDPIKKVDEPHIMQGAETNVRSYDITNPSDILGQAPDPMKIDVVLGIKVAFNVGTENIYSSFFKNDFAKYIKVRIVQSTNSATSDSIVNNMEAQLPLIGTVADSMQLQGASIQSKEFTEFEGTQPELSLEKATSVEVSYDSAGNKTYIFPYKFKFIISDSEGGIKADHLAYFAHAYIDIDEIETDEALFGDIDLPKSVVDKLTMGGVSFQNVIQGGSINNFSQVFYTTPTDSEGNPTNFPNLLDESGNIIGKDYSAETIWTGPVHYHGPNNPGPDGYIGYMAGQGGADMGPFLTQEAVSDNIIQDFREVKELEKLNFDYSLFSNSWLNQETTERFQNNIKGLKNTLNVDNPYAKDSDDIELAIVKSLTSSKNKSIFGNLYTSMDGSGNTRFIFNINMKEAIKQNTVFPKLVDILFQGGSANAQQLLNQKLITDFKIYRYRVYDENPAHPEVDIYEKVANLDPKLVVASSEDVNGILIPKQEIVFGESNKEITVKGTIKQVEIDLPYNNTEEIKFYTGVDLQTPIEGDYIFEIELSIEDPIIPWMKDRISEMEFILYGDPSKVNTGEKEISFKSYMSDSKSSPDYYNLYTNRFTQAGIDYLEQEYGTGGQGYAFTQISQFFSIVEKFTSFDKGVYNLFNFLTTVSSTNYGNPSGIETVFKVMENMYGKILDVFSSASKYKKPTDSQHVESQYSAGSNPKRQFGIKHKFNTEIKGEINHLTGYDYLSQFDTTNEDSLVGDGLKNLSFDTYNSRISKEVAKLFPVLPQDPGSGQGTPLPVSASPSTNILIYKEPLADLELATTSQEAQEILDLEGELFFLELDLKAAKKEYDDYLLSQGGYYDYVSGKVIGANTTSEKQAEFQNKIKIAEEKIPLKKQEIQEKKQQLPYFLEKYQGIALNGGDSVGFTKYAYLSPSIVNFSNAESHNLLNSGNMVTDVRKLNNILLNIIKYNSKSQEEFDFAQINQYVATGVEIDGTSGQDKVIPSTLDSELKYDLLKLLSSRQTTVFSAQQDISTNTTNAGGILGGSTSGEADLDNTDTLSILYEISDSQISYNPIDIFTSTANPTSILLTSVEQKYFNMLEKEDWTWEYYVQDFEKTFYKEYQAWNGIAVDPNPYTFDNSPLKRAPNHIKALMLHLDWTKQLTNPAFDAFEQHLKKSKPYAYNYDIPEGQVYGTDSANYYGVASKAGEVNGLVSYSQIYPKNKVIYQTPEFLSFFLLNYKNIMKIECLLGYDGDAMNNPIWNELTLEIVELLKERQKSILCRMVPYEKEFYGIRRYKFMEMPVYNDHFIIKFENDLEVLPSPDQQEAERNVSIVVSGKRETLRGSDEPEINKDLFNFRNLPTYNRQRAEDIRQSSFSQSQETIRSTEPRSGEESQQQQSQTDVNTSVTSAGIGIPGVINYNT